MDLRSVLSGLRHGAEVKRYADEPKGVVPYRDYLFTYCIENVAIGRQPTLGISLLNREELVALPADVLSAIHDVFGAPVFSTHTWYPKRGYTILYCWGVGL